MPQYVLHVDLDQFIAAVESLRRPDLLGKPVVVGADGDPTQRGVVSTANYEARAFGIHSGMPLRTAYRRCPEAVFLPVDRPAYEAASSRVMAALRSFPAVVEVAGWDEAFLQVEAEDPESLAHGIQQTVLARTELWCSIGIGDNKVRAKIATGYGKPARIFRLTGDNWNEVMGGQPVESLWGIGSKTGRRLAWLGIRTVDDLAAADEPLLARTFGPRNGPWLRRLARGESEWAVSAEPYQRKSLGRERTFQVDLGNLTEIRAEARRLALEVADDLSEEGRDAIRVVVKVRFAPFFTCSHGVRLAEPTIEPAAIERAALEALSRFDLDRPVRLVGVRADLVGG
ncbi:MAG TPA: DNA polymerase IV [Actinomycetota bacterium]|jgi:DNA polymerase-4|nr:DNA polymerase IV [Actinomycetota bacterium]